MNKINFTEVFKNIKNNYNDYIKLPKIFGSIMQNEPSLTDKIDGDKWVMKIYNLASGILYISVKMYNAHYTIKMFNDTLIQDFYFAVYEDEDFDKVKFSVGAKPKYKKYEDGNGQYDHRYLTIRYLSDKCNYDIDDTNVNEEMLINFLNSLGDDSLFKKLFLNNPY